MQHISSYRTLTDDALIASMSRLAGAERHATADLVSALVEFECRKLHLALGFSSLFDYCVRALHLTEHEALNRIEAARAARRFPQLLWKLADGELSLTAIRLLAPQLTSDNVEEVIRQAKNRNTEGIKLLIATLHPQPPVPSVIRKLPEPKPAAVLAAASAPVSVAPVPDAPVLVAPALVTDGPSTAPAERLTPPAATQPPASRRPVIAPLSEAHYKLQVTISASARERLAQIQDLMRHRLPTGDPAAIVEHALEVLHAELLKQKAAEVAKPRAGKDASAASGRYIPASVRREVWRRDHGKCVFRGPDGKACGSTSGVEFHHVQPYATGGVASAANIEMRCRAHNGFEWERHLEEETLALVSQTT